MYHSFEEMSNDSRVWIFQSTINLEYEKVERISARLMNFLENWQAHGQNLQASFTILHSQFIAIALNEASYQATGCSIDKLTHLIQNLEKELGISLMDPTQIAFRDENQMIQTVHMVNFRAELENGSFNENTVVFNNLIKTKGELLQNWETNIANSWHKQWLPVA